MARVCPRTVRMLGNHVPLASKVRVPPLHAAAASLQRGKHCARVSNEESRSSRTPRCASGWP
eukprot:4166929-Prymnesium_polylepis.1